MAKSFITVSIDDKALNDQISKALKRNPIVTAQKVAACALDLAGKSAERAPIESGDLRNNCNAQINGQTIYEKKKKISTMVKALKAEASIGYSLPYAPRQHEDLSLRHDRTDGYRVPAQNKRTGKDNKTAGLTVNMIAGGEAKYLERPFEENKAEYIKMIESIPDEVLK